MLSVIVDASGAEDRLAGLFAQLTGAAVDGLVREVLVAGPVRSEVVAEAMDALCEDTGASLAGDLRTAIGQAKSDWLLVLPAEIRFADGWVERLRDRVAEGPRAAVVEGLKPPGFFAPRPSGVLISRAKAAQLTSLAALRRQQAADRIRLG